MFQIRVVFRCVSTLLTFASYVRFLHQLDMEFSKDVGDTDSSYHSSTMSQHAYHSKKDDVESRPDIYTGTGQNPPKDPNVVDWNGPDDPENPMNWPSSEELAARSMVSIITMLS